MAVQGEPPSGLLWLKFSAYGLWVKIIKVKIIKVEVIRSLG